MAITAFRMCEAFAAITVLAGIPAHASISFNVSFESSITSDPDASAIEGDINSVISDYESLITNNITVPVEFGEMTSGLGESEWYY